MSNYRNLWNQQYQYDLNLRTQVDKTVRAQDDYSLISILKRFAGKVVRTVAKSFVGQYGDPVIDLVEDLFYWITGRRPRTR